MATKKVKAPVGYHFMRNKEGDFYIMENPPTGYKRHFEGKYSSTLTIEVELKEGGHTSSPAPARAYKAPTQSRTSQAPPTRNNNNRRSGY